MRASHLHSPTARLGRAAARAVLAVTALTPVAVLLAVTPATWRAATEPGADAGALLAGLAAAVGWAVTARLLVTTLAVALAAVPGAVGRGCGRVAMAWSPALARSLVRAALGAAVVTGPVLAQAAAWADQPPYPTLDRVITEPVTAPAPTAPAIPPAVAGGHPSRAPGSGHVVVVRPGDTLWGIAAAHLPAQHSDAEVAQAWPAWYAANRQSIGPDPDRIIPGTQLVPPSPSR